MKGDSRENRMLRKMLAAHASTRGGAAPSRGSPSATSEAAQRSVELPAAPDAMFASSASAVCSAMPFMTQSCMRSSGVSLAALLRSRLRFRVSCRQEVPHGKGAAWQGAHARHALLAAMSSTHVHAPTSSARELSAHCSINGPTSSSSAHPSTPS